MMGFIKMDLKEIEALRATAVGMTQIVGYQPSMLTGQARDFAHCVIALCDKFGHALDALQEADIIMGHDDAETEWREKWAWLWPNQ
jgi:hypothetical protein